MRNITVSRYLVEANKGASIAQAVSDAVELATKEWCDVVLVFNGTEIPILASSFNTGGWTKTEAKSAAVQAYNDAREGNRVLAIQEDSSVGAYEFRLKTVVAEMVNEIGKLNTDEFHKTDETNMDRWQNIALGRVTEPEEA